MPKVRFALVVLLVLAVALSACAQPAAPVAPQPTEAPAAPTAAPAPTQAPEPQAAAGGVVKATPGQAFKMILLPKFLGILVFDQANQGAQEAAKELQNPETLEFLGPTPENSVAGQIEIVTNAATQGAAGDHDLQQRRRPDRAGGQGRQGRRHERRHLGLADPVRAKASSSSSPRWTSTRPAR